MGASAGIMQRDESNKEFHPDDIRSLLKNRKASDALFTTIAQKVSKDEGRINSSSSINVRNLVSYFKDDPNPKLKVFVPDKEVLVYAHKHVCEVVHEKKRGKQKKLTKAKDNKLDMDSLMSENIGRDAFFLLMSTIYLYSHIWKIFTIMDEMEIADKKITKHEFMQAREHERMKELKFLTNIENISEEDWELAYSEMDSNADGAISFEEACKFTLDTLLYVPTDFLAGEVGEGTLRSASFKSSSGGGGSNGDYQYVSASDAVREAESKGLLEAPRFASIAEPSMQLTNSEKVSLSINQQEETHMSTVASDEGDSNTPAPQSAKMTDPATPPVFSASNEPISSATEAV